MKDSMDVEENKQENGKIEEFTVTDNVEFDDALAKTGYGWFHYEILAVCALCLLCSGFQNGLSAYVFPASKCELHLSSAQLGTIHAIFMVGGVSSSFLWGSLADVYGRKTILLLTLPMDFLVTVVCCFMNSFYGVLICRYLNGFIIGAPSSITFSYLGEFHAPPHRTKSICYSGIFFTIAWLLLPTISYIILPLNVRISLAFLPDFTQWRLLLFILGLPEIVTFFWLTRLPESPKFLESRGERKEALDILAKMYALNNGKEVEDYPVQSLMVGLGQDSTKVNKEQKVACSGRTARMVREMLNQFKKLFTPPLLGLSILVSVIVFANMYGYFGLGLWLPELFNRFEQFQQMYPNRTVSVPELTKFGTSVVAKAAEEIISVNVTGPIEECTVGFDISIFRNTAAVGVCCMMGNALSGYFSGKVSLKVIPLVTMLAGGLSSLSIFWLTSGLQNLIVSCIFQSAMATGNMALGGVAVDLFPTAVGAMAVCLTMCAGRVGAIVSNAIFGIYMDEKCEVPIFSVAIIVLTGAVLSYFIPNHGPKENKQENTKENGDENL